MRASWKKLSQVPLAAFFTKEKKKYWMQVEPEQFWAIHMEPLWLSLKGFRNTFHLYFRLWSSHEIATFSSNQHFCGKVSHLKMESISHLLYY